MIGEIILGVVFSYIVYESYRASTNESPSIYGKVNVYKDGVEIDNIVFPTYAEYDAYITDIARYGEKGVVYILKDAETGSELGTVKP